MVQQLQNPEHERSYLYIVTPKGKEAFLKIQNECLKLLNKITNDASEQYLMDTQIFINTISDNIEDIHKK